MSNNSKDLLANSVHSDQYYALQMIGIIVIAAFSKVEGGVRLEYYSTQYFHNCPLHAGDFYMLFVICKLFPKIPSECQTVWIQIRPDICQA